MNPHSSRQGTLLRRGSAVPLLLAALVFVQFLLSSEILESAVRAAVLRRILSMDSVDATLLISFLVLLVLVVHLTWPDRSRQGTLLRRGSVGVLFLAALVSVQFLLLSQHLVVRPPRHDLSLGLAHALKREGVNISSSKFFSELKTRQQRAGEGRKSDNETTPPNVVYSSWLLSNSSRVLLAVLSINTDYRKPEWKSSHLEYAKRHGYAYLQIRRPLAPQARAPFTAVNRLLAPLAYQEYDYVVLLDQDVLISPTAPAIHVQLTNSSQIGIVNVAPQYPATVCLCACVYNGCVCVCVCVCVRARARVCVCVCVYICIYIYIGAPPAHCVRDHDGGQQV